MKAFAVLLVLAISTPAMAAPAESKNAKKERLICKRDVRTASRMNTQRSCRTYAQWEEHSRANGNTEDSADTLEVIGEKISTGDLGGMQSGDSPRR